MVDDQSPNVADYFVTVGLNNLKKPDNDGETLEPITDLAVIFKSLGESPPPGYECIEYTPSGLTADLNHGSIRTQTCFICYKRGRDKPPLTDIGVLYEGRQRLMHGCDIVHKTPTKQVANVNNGNNMRIFITYRRASPQFAHSSLAVIEICVVIANKGEKPPHAFCLVEKNLNQGLVGSEVYLCYRKSLSRSNSLSYSAEIISRYPQVDYDEYPLPDSVPLFCLPLGAVVECWPEKAQPPLPIFSTFALTGAKGEKIYGAGVTFFEEFPSEKFTNEVFDLIKQQQENHKDKKLVAQTNKCICLLSRYPFFDAFRRFLMSLYRLTVSGVQNIPIERYIYHFMHNVPFPTPQKPIVYIQITHEGFEIHQPAHGPLPVSGASFSALLRCLGTDNTLVLLYCILTEQKILVHSLRPALLTSVCEALTALIFPFQWKCPYIPLCPLKLADVLFAPFPFIYGIDSRYFDRSSPPTDVTCVDLDTNMITQAIDSKDTKSVTWKVLPKKPGKMLKDKLDELFLQLYQVANEDNNSAVEMAPIDDLTADKKKKFIEIAIQEAFLRFHAQILNGYKQYLLPITSRPDIGSRDLKTLFDLQGFVRSRPRGTEKFFDQLTHTQLFSHFVENRSLSSGNDAVLAFFDECTEKAETSARLLHVDSNQANTTTVVVTPPDLTGLPPNETYTYHGFPKLRDELFTNVSRVVTNLKIPKIPNTPPRSPRAGRTPHERYQGSVSAKKQANSPTLWARCLLGHCFTIWFIHLPSYVKYQQNKESILYKAFEVLQRISESKAKLPDEVCYRVLMQLSGQFDHPALAVKVLFEMKRNGIEPNAITWGYYHKAVLEGEWLPEVSRRTPKQLWNRLRVAIMAMFAFRKNIAHKVPSCNNLINLGGSHENLNAQNNVRLPFETASVGTASDGGYSSELLSTEDLTRQHPVADDFTGFPDVTLISDINQDSLKGHRRNLSVSSQTSESDNELISSLINLPKRPITRRLSETSIGSNLSESSHAASSHIIVCHEPWGDSYDKTYQPGSTSELYDQIGPSPPSLRGGMKSNIALEATICSCQVCTTCDKLIYDEEVMGGWSADDSNLNIVCPFCQTKKVPTLNIKVKDYRGLNSKVCSSTSLSSDVSYSASSSVDGRRSASIPLLHIDSNKSLNTIQSNNVMNSGSCNDTRQLEQFFSSVPATPSKPVSIKPVKKISHDMMASSSAPTSASSSPVLGLGSSGRRPAFFKHRKSSSTGSNFNMFIGTPEEKMVTSVPYLSPLVLRKELENMLENNGDLKLQSKEIVTEKPILYWNLIWYFRRLELRSHLPSLLLQAYSENGEESPRRVGAVVVSTSWDLNRQRDVYVPLYMLWNVPNEKQDLIVDRGWTPRSVLTTISAHIQTNNVITPIKILLDERSRQQQQHPDVHWSIYRELMFLSLTSCGTENIDVDAFDREYKIAYRDVIRQHSERLYPDDKPPTVKAVFCRQAFDAPTLQPRKPRL